MTIEALRASLNTLDEQLQALLLQRLHLMQDVAAVKQAQALALYDAAREQEILQRLTKNTSPQQAAAIRDIYETVLFQCRCAQANAAFKKEEGVRLFVLHGPNMQRLGQREPAIYGTTSFLSLCEQIRAYATQRGAQVLFAQSDDEGELVRLLHLAHTTADAVVLNPAAYSHTSVALHDAIRAGDCPVATVHLSEPEKREAFRRTDYCAQASRFYFAGEGLQSYRKAVDALVEAVQNAQSLR